MDTGRKLNVHKTIGRCSGGLQNALCAFNLRNKISFSAQLVSPFTHFIPLVQGVFIEKGQLYEMGSRKCIESSIALTWWIPVS